jgi:predicted flavoprotein YhiN
VEFNLLPEINAAELVAAGRREAVDAVTLLSRHWPRRFAEAWCVRHAPAKSLPHFTAAELTTFTTLLRAWPLHFSGTEGYPKAEVTLGGVDTSELSSKTMEARRVPGLFFIGEVVDVTGWLGGYNFQWAWASGQAAGQSV